MVVSNWNGVAPMTAVLKFRGGPLAGQYQSATSLGERFVITKPRAFDYQDFSLSEDPFYAPVVSRDTGFYSKTNIRTKTGAYVFQWMGWEGEVIAR